MARKPMSDETKAKLRAKKADRPVHTAANLTADLFMRYLDKVVEEQFGGDLGNAVCLTSDLVYPRNESIPGRTTGGYLAQPKGGRDAYHAFLTRIGDHARAEMRGTEHDTCGLCRLNNADAGTLAYLVATIPHRWVLRQSGGDTCPIPVFPYRLLYAVLKEAGYPDPDKFLVGGTGRLMRDAHPQTSVQGRYAGSGLCMRDSDLPLVCNTLREAFHAMRSGDRRRHMGHRDACRVAAIINAVPLEILDAEPGVHADLTVKEMANRVTYYGEGLFGGGTGVALKSAVRTAAYE